jgi:hypothetical protein
VPAWFDLDHPVRIRIVGPSDSTVVSRTVPQREFASHPVLEARSTRAWPAGEYRVELSAVEASEPGFEPDATNYPFRIR